MSSEVQSKKYDFIFIGTSMICVLEAVYQNLCGKSVLMIDRQEDMGGAWLPIDIFGCHDVENAIHYFLPDPYSFNFMKNVLQWDVLPSPRKYRVFPLPFGRCWKISYDNVWGRLASKVKEAILTEKKRHLPLIFLRACLEGFSEKRQPSYYVAGGAVEMLKKVKAILLASSVEVKYSVLVDRIYINKETSSVEVSAGKEVFFAKAIFFTHGSRISNLTEPSGPFLINEKNHPRPAVHLLVNDSMPSEMYECVFTADPVIKYVHDVTRMTRESAQLLGKKKIFVLALHMDVKEQKLIYPLIFEKLRRVGMVGKKAILEAYYWQDIFLPRLDDADLYGLKARFGKQVEILRTEDFSKGIGYHAQRWATKIKFPNQQSLKGEH